MDYSSCIIEIKLDLAVINDFNEFIEMNPNTKIHRESISHPDNNNIDINIITFPFVHRDNHSRGAAQYTLLPSIKINGILKEVFLLNRRQEREL